MLISIDCESTGLDRAFGARPFLVTICQDTGRQLLWEWVVDPYTRQVSIPAEHITEIQCAIDSADEIVAHNLKFDVENLQAAGIIDDWPWEKSNCSLVAGHLLASGMPHDLTSIVVHYLGHDIKPHEEVLREAVMSARRLTKQFGVKTDDVFADSLSWHIARDGDPTMPSADSGAWHFDYWLPRAIAQYLRYESTHPWWTVCSTYANADSAHTLLLWQKLKREIQAKDLWTIYRESMNVPRVIAKMETRGVSYDIAEGARLRAEYKAESEQMSARCIAVAKQFDYNLELPKSKANNSVRHFAFGYDDCRCEVCGNEFRDRMSRDECRGHLCSKKKCANRQVTVLKSNPLLNLPPVSFTASGLPSLDADSFTHWQATLQAGTPQREFVMSMASKGEVDTCVQYLDSYRRFCKDGRLHPNLNQTGTAHLRMSSNSPNGQNVSKKLRPCRRCSATGQIDGQECPKCKGEGEASFNLRRAFCPAREREFWACDYENIELRIPGYEAGEKLMIELFEKPNEPPFFGSQHLLNASIAYPDLFWPLAKQKGAFKKKYASTWYQWIKNFDFALAYQCGEKTGDEAAHKKGTWRAVRHTLKELTRLSEKWISFANRHGYVETLPDKTVDPRRGYPLMTSRGSYGDVSPTIPLNYHVSGTAMWCTRKAMVRCQAQLDQWNEEVLVAHGLQFATQAVKTFCLDLYGYHIALQIHDEILFDFPKGGRRNLSRIMKLKELMEKSGDDIGIPLRVAVGYHPKNWAESEELKLEVVT